MRERLPHEGAEEVHVVAPCRFHGFHRYSVGSRRPAASHAPQGLGEKLPQLVRRWAVTGLWATGLQVGGLRGHKVGVRLSIEDGADAAELRE